MLTPDTIADAISVAVVGAISGAFIDQAIPSDAQQWTAMGLVAAVLFWLMYRVTKSCDAMATAMADSGKALALLTQQAEHAQHATEQKRTDIVNRIDRLTEHVQSLKAS